MTKMQRKKAQEIFDDFEMLTGWPPEHQEAVFAGGMEIKKAIAENVKSYQDWSKRVNANLKAMLNKL